MEREWSCYAGGQLNEGEWSCYKDGQFNGESMLLRWPINGERMVFY